MNSHSKTKVNNNQSIDGYLYIPFKGNEISEDYINMIDDFLKGSAGEFKNKSFMVLFHGKCNLAELPENSKIYIMAHGYDISPNKKTEALLMNFDLPYDDLKHIPVPDWAYAVSAGARAVTIDTIANRMIEDGLLGLNTAQIKLWFCDKHNKAQAFAKRFCEPFKEYSNNFRVDYYQNQFLYNYVQTTNGMHKGAVDASNPIEIERASKVREAFFTKHKNDAQIEADHHGHHHKKNTKSK